MFEHDTNRFELLILRLRSGVKQYELAERLGIAASQLSAFEKRGQKLPGGKSENDYRSALAEIISRRDVVA
ncbi:MAG: hypothetical protein HQ477_02015 [Chloroflexi bacterium]|nr:hypothetical protein [Chloroflexota bacterium]